MRSLRPLRPVRRLRRGRALPLVVAAFGTAAALATPAAGAAAAGATVAAGATPTSIATATPGMGAPLPCATDVSYTIDGKNRTTRPLPAPVSQVGGARLAEPGLQLTPSAAAPPSPRASAWMVADLDTGKVLAACNAHVPLAPASALKVLTALALLPKINSATRYTARHEDAAVDGTRVGLVPGSVYTVDNLWHALLMSSANDAAVALGALAGGLPAATGAMLSTARSLGAADTVPHNTSGLDSPGQVSSAYDLALFGRAALADHRLVTVMQTRDYAFPEAGTALPGSRTATGAVARKTFQIQSHDKLLYNYPGALGVKNGWTSTTGGSYIGAAQRGGRRLIVTVIAADPQTWQMSAALLDWGFAATTAASPGVGRLVDGPDPDGALPGSTSARSAPAGTAVAMAGTAHPEGAEPAGGLPGGTVAASAVALLVLLVLIAALAAVRARSARRRER
jgi:serine-type D-Ala-D-Ala carboxypeptidase (penicillin-binding protein 5/6)